MLRPTKEHGRPQLRLGRRVLQFGEDFIHVEARRLLPLRIVLKRQQELAHVVLRGDHQEGVIKKPVVVGVRRDVRALIRVSAEVEDFRNTQVGERVSPNEHCSRSTLLHEHKFPIVVSQPGQLLVVVDVKERLPRALRSLSGQVRHEVVAVEMDLVGHVADLVAGEQFVLDLRITGDGQNRRQHVEVGDDLVGDLARLDLARPAEHRRNPVGAFPVRVLLAAERRHRSVRPAVHVRTVVGRVHDEGVVGDAEIIQRLEDRADILVMIDHGVVIRALPASRLADAFRLGVGAEVHVGGVHPNEERLAGLCCRLMKSTARSVMSSSMVTIRSLVSGPVSLHTCLPTLPKRGSTVGSSMSEALQSMHAARAELGAERRVFRVVRQFRLFLGVEVIEVAVELVEAVHGRQKFVAVAEVVLAELSGGVAERLEQFGDRRVFLLQPERSAGQADLGQTGAQAGLAGDERGPAGGAALLGVVVGEQHALRRQGDRCWAS